MKLEIGYFIFGFEEKLDLREKFLYLQSAQNIVYVYDVKVTEILIFINFLSSIQFRVSPDKSHEEM